MPTCTTCQVLKSETDFERSSPGVLRKQCKECRKKQRKLSVAKAPKVDPETVPKPLSCAHCSKGPGEVEFKWRPETNNWRNTCKNCYNAKNYCASSRARLRETDETSFLQNNARNAKKWRDNNKQHVTEQI